MTIRGRVVEEVRCLRCKRHMEEWPDDLRGRELDTGEVLCETCVGDLREGTEAITTLGEVPADGL